MTWLVACECLIVWRCTYVEGRSQFEAGNKPRNKVIQLTMPVSIKPRANHASEASYHCAWGFVDCLPFYLSPVFFDFWCNLIVCGFLFWKATYCVPKLTEIKARSLLVMLVKIILREQKLCGPCFDKCQSHIAFYISWITVYSCFM